MASFAVWLEENLSIDFNNKSQEEKDEKLLSCLHDYYSVLKSSTEKNWSIRSGIQKLVTHYPQTALNELAKLIKIKTLNQGEIKNPEKEEIDWMVGGLCHVSVEMKKEKTISYCLDEVF